MSSPPRISAIHIGLIYSPEDAFRLVDHGPAVEEQDTGAAKEFRQLWGPKAELRRFKDGRIVESVVWDVKTSDERAHIPTFIVRHLLHLHFGIPIADIQTIATPFDAKLRLPDCLASLHQHSGVTGGFKAALTAFDGLVKNLKALDEKLPLALLNVSPISEYLRYTSTFSPLPIPLASTLALPTPLRYLPQIPIVLEFEKSSKWPDDLCAIQKIKLAFFETIASALMTANPGLRAAVHIEQLCDSDIQDHASLEILTPEGWSFSARIWHDREAVLLERLASSVKTTINPHPRPSKDQRMACRAMDLYTRRFIHAPRHHRAIATLSHRYIAYPGTVRLVKRWLASHWLLGIHVSEEAVEIICAHPFVGTGVALPDTAVSIPRSKERGFALVMEFLKDWKPENPLFVPLYEDNSPLTEPSVVAVSSKEGVWTISTSEDPGGKMWTSSGPDVVAAHRLCALAKEAYKILQDTDVDPRSVKVRVGFKRFSLVLTVSCSGFSLMQQTTTILLSSSTLPYCPGTTKTSTLMSWCGRKVVWVMSTVTRCRAQGLIQLACCPTICRCARCTVLTISAQPDRFNQSMYSDTLKFFFDIYGGHRIGAIWLLNVSGIRPFRALGGFSSTPTTEVRSSMFAYACDSTSYRGQIRKKRRKETPFCSIDSPSWTKLNGWEQVS
jgi:U3 small nucleolar RNA-associated protein 22